MEFDAQPYLRSDMLTLRPLRADDRDALADAASDLAIWAGHPARHRYKRSVFDPYFDALLASRGTLVAQVPTSAQIIGCSRYYPAPEGPDDIGIGFTFLTRPHWGGSMNREMKTLMLEHAFLQRDRVWFHIDPTNIRSQKATLKIGARCVETGEKQVGGSTALWQCYVITRKKWQTLRRQDQADQSP